MYRLRWYCCAILNGGRFGDLRTIYQGCRALPFALAGLSCCELCRWLLCLKYFQLWLVGSRTHWLCICVCGWSGGCATAVYFFIHCGHLAAGAILFTARLMNVSNYLVCDGHVGGVESTEEENGSTASDRGWLRLHPSQLLPEAARDWDESCQHHQLIPVITSDWLRCVIFVDWSTKNRSRFLKQVVIDKCLHSTPWGWAVKTYFYNNFGKCGPISTILSLLDS